MLSVSACWVSKNLSAHDRHWRVASSQKLLGSYTRDKEVFCRHLVNGDKTWIYHWAPLRKLEFMQWKDVDCPTLTQICKSAINWLDYGNSFPGIQTDCLWQTICILERQLKSLDLFSRSRERNFSTSENRDQWPPDSRPVVSCTRHPGAGRRSRPPVALHVCFLTGAPLRRRSGRCPPSCLPILPQRRPIVQRRPTGREEGRHGDSPARRPRADRPLHVPGRAPPVASSRFATFLVRHSRLCWSIDRVPALAGNSMGTGRRSPPPPLAPPQAIQLRSRQ